MANIWVRKELKYTRSGTKRRLFVIRQKTKVKPSTMFRPFTCPMVRFEWFLTTKCTHSVVFGKPSRAIGRWLNCPKRIEGWRPHSWVIIAYSQYFLLIEKPCWCKGKPPKQSWSNCLYIWVKAYSQNCF